MFYIREDVDSIFQNLGCTMSFGFGTSRRRRARAARRLLLRHRVTPTGGAAAAQALRVLSWALRSRSRLLARWVRMAARAASGSLRAMAL